LRTAHTYTTAATAKHLENAASAAQPEGPCRARGEPTRSLDYGVRPC